MMKELPHIGKILRAFVDKKKIPQSWWSRQAGVSEKTIATYLKNPTIRLDTLFKICQQLEYNFIREIADALPDNLPPEKVIDQSAKIAELEKRNTELTNEVATLKEALRLVGGR